MSLVNHLRYITTGLMVFGSGVCIRKLLGKKEEDLTKVDYTTSIGAACLTLASVMLLSLTGDGSKAAEELKSSIAESC